MRLLKTVLVFAFSMAIIGGCQSQTTNENVQIRNVDVAAFSGAMESSENYIILDVRTPAEVAEGIIEGAVVINFFDTDFAERVAQLETEKPILVYCRSGARSGQAAKVLEKVGFTDITNLSGGTLAWLRSGKTVVNP